MTKRPSISASIHRWAAYGNGAVASACVRCVKDAPNRDALFPAWRYHPFVTNTDLPTAEADITHRHRAIIETVFAA